MTTVSDSIARILDNQIAAPSVEILVDLIHKNTESNDLHDINADRCKQAIKDFLIDFLLRYKDDSFVKTI
jgi:hypothetical protein